VSSAGKPASGSRSSLCAASRLGPYEIVAPLGAGGMGEVYRARDPRLGREIAIKVLSSELSLHPERRERFEREARSASALNHPSIVTIHEFGQVDSTFYIAMELVEGDTLRALLEGGPLPLRRVIQIAAQVADGLAKAHEAGITHRDLKPENVMVSRDGFAKILDFGLAKLSAAEAATAPTLSAAATQPGTVMGTPAYMSPEQASGRPLDFRSDQFSFGALLYEALTGKPAFLRGSQIETLTAILRDDPPPIGTLNRNAPAPLCWLVERCLARNSAERYPSTRDLARELATMRDCFLQPAAAPPEMRASNLPAQRTTFVGREREIAELCGLLLRSDVRLVTMTGPGGIGKTRLALQVAERNFDRYPGGVHFVALGSVRDPALMPILIARALGVKQTGGQAALRNLKEFLLDSAAGPLLLVLDNLEHLAPAAALVSDLLVAGANLTVLATSRASLHIYGEHEFPVPPLAPPSDSRSLAALRGSPAVELFVQRALAVKPGFELTAENAASVANICKRLDGLPLAIELAAARVKVLSPSAIEARLASRLQLLTSGARDLPERQQTLRGTIDWSYQLLTPAEQQLFRRLSVLVGGWTLEAVEAVCNTEGDLGIDVFDGVASVVDKSLAQQLDVPEEARFAMLETIREYGLMRLAESGEEPKVRRAHAAYCLVLAEEGGAITDDGERNRWSDRLELEHDNLRAALDWLAQTGHADWALRLGAALFRFWESREQLSEGRDRLQKILALPKAQAPTKERARVLFAAGVLAAAQGDYRAGMPMVEESLTIARELQDQPGIAVGVNALAVLHRDCGDHPTAHRLFEEGLARWRQLGDRVAEARSLSNLANVVRAEGDFALARSLYQQSLEIFRDLGDQAGMAWSLNAQGDTAREAGDHDAARAFYEQGLAIFRALEDRWGIAGSLADLGNLACERGGFAAAHDYHSASLKVFEQLGHKRGIARLLECLACSAAAQSKPERALRLAGAAAALRHALGAPLTTADQKMLDSRIAPARQALGHAAGTAAWVEGWELPVETAIAAALSEQKD
jgi:predicted ATPase